MKTTRDEIECAIAVGLSFSLPLYLIFTNPIFDLDAEFSPFTLRDAEILLMFFASYALAPFLYQQIKASRFSRLIPSWVFFALWGSLCFIFIDSLFEASFFYFSGWKSMLIEFTYLTIYTMSVGTIVYYLASIVRCLRKWFAGERENISLLRK